ncbi:hypothetical protein RRG08_060496 [Elysia crispata]|uniref:PiggyBac transposable element-derived protein domain-containing protein n=1 Tax=Elysia crispata TaxID=231223 RepID=A0AAE1B055_9GAST|nr:hypothetical protein RRG08_060496 [Elysia crispata]
MPSNIWALIDRMLHVNDITREIPRGQDGFDPWTKVKAVLDKVNESAIHFYLPSQNISIDESMIGMKNRGVYIQFMSSKHHARFGIKKFEVCDSNGYVLHIRLCAALQSHSYSVSHNFTKWPNPQQNLSMSLSLLPIATRKTVTCEVTEVRTKREAKEGREPDTGVLGARWDAAQYVCRS